MLRIEKGVLEPSDYYIHTPSTQASRTFFYPMGTGYFHYAPGYHLHRTTYDSFLVMLVKKGEFYVYDKDGIQYTAREGQIVMLDCYIPHAYGTTDGGDLLYLHLDGPVARAYYEMITASGCPILTLTDNFRFEKYLNRIYQLFKNGTVPKDALLSQYITTLFTELLMNQAVPPGIPDHSDIIEETVAYINEHLSEKLPLDFLARRANISPYYFTRLFKKETGFTPHEYQIAARINTAKFLLKNTSISVKEICFSIGFSNESSFCTTFKKWVKQTPTSYRMCD